MMTRILLISLALGLNISSIKGQADELRIHFPLPSLAKVFKRLETKGERDIAPKKAEFPQLKQFISFTVVSGPEIIAREKIDDSRIETLINEKLSSGNSPCSGISCKKAHGEILAIYDGKLAAAIKNFQADNPKTIPVVVMFSHYIPCYGIREKDVKYSCAEELSNFVFAHQGKIKMIVVYRDVYEGTEKKMSVRYMTADGIDVYEKTDRGKYTRVFFDNGLEDIKRGSAVFQNLLFKCLKDPDEEYMCTMTCIGSEDVAIKLISYFVNLATHYCTKDQAYSARLSNLTKQVLFKCVSNYIDQQISRDCTKCRHKTRDFNLYAKICTAFAKHYSSFVGFNKRPFDPYSKDWVDRAMLWKDLYRKDFETLGMARPAVYCAFRQVDSQSMCTRIRRSDKYEEGFKLQVRDLQAESKPRNK